MKEKQMNAVLKVLHPTQGSSFKWIQSKFKMEEDQLSSILLDLLKQGLISNGTCDDSACSACSGGCKDLKANDLVMYTITKKGLETRK